MHGPLHSCDSNVSVTAMTTAWTEADVGLIEPAAVSAVPPLCELDRSDLCDNLVYWDMWPVAGPDGCIARLAGREFWMALSALRRDDPGLRHFEAKIRLLERVAGRWADRGAVLAAGAPPYEREWAGSATTDGTAISLYFTGAGLAGRPGGYQQQLFEAHASILPDGMPAGWSEPAPSIARLTRGYMPADAHDGAPGTIKAFRDPAWFRDPADGQDYLLFTGSLANSNSDYNGAVGIARKSAQGWEPLPPLISAEGVNNELERAHAVFHGGRYYVFWVTQSATFAPPLFAPTGLYGMVADTLFGPYRPLNRGGLVLRNPSEGASQTYSWFVSADLIVSSFVDVSANAPSRFGGVPAPLLRLWIDGERCGLALDPGT